MAVAKSRISRRRAGMRKAHTAMKPCVLTMDSMTGDTALYHHVGENGFYKGVQLIKPRKAKKEKQDS